ncbi:hypothetical protein GLOIN_2v574929 [Rhizophagus clarus]|uniref:Uncharacterized protein n=1 Tax=Rhizophagus clarus TaxID=94130 RepID=A0A8H3L3E8_9GLOM|nr:hypothetical protein GLOIN_2v574929 [Rhizophagus clarus]
MKTPSIIMIFLTLYLVICICAEFGYLITLYEIGSYDDYDVIPEKIYLIYLEVFYFIGILLSLMFIWLCECNSIEGSLLMCFT